MRLWIKEQINNELISTNSEQFTYKKYENKYMILWGEHLLGYYETSERVKDIIKEIEKLKKTIDNSKAAHDSTILHKEFDSNIYKMPKK